MSFGGSADLATTVIGTSVMRPIESKSLITSYFSPS